jgi:pimeloyl-ACP methyl ester carboxylesterase
VPCLNLCGATSGCFPLAGLEAVGEAVPDCCTVVFERANHWLYLEQPEAFNALVASFAAARNVGRPRRSSVG